MWTKTKTTLSSVTSYHSDLKVLAEAVDVEAAHHDHPYVTWIQEAFVQSSNRVALISVSDCRNYGESASSEETYGNKIASNCDGLKSAVIVHSGACSILQLALIVKWQAGRPVDRQGVLGMCNDSLIASSDPEPEFYGAWSL